MTDIKPTPARVEMQRGSWAHELRENQLLHEALTAWEKEITEAWKTSPLRDAEGRERLRLMLEASAKFKAFISQTIETAELAKVPTQRGLLDKVRARW